MRVVSDFETTLLEQSYDSKKPMLKIFRASRIYDWTNPQDENSFYRCQEFMRLFKNKSEYLDKVKVLKNSDFEKSYVMNDDSIYLLSTLETGLKTLIKLKKDFSEVREYSKIAYKICAGGFLIDVTKRPTTLNLMEDCIKCGLTIVFD